MSADLDPRDFGEVRRRIVEPVVRSLIRPDELAEVLVCVDRGDVYVRVMAREELVTCAFLGPLADGPWDPVEKADRVYDALTDDLLLTDLGWGEHREGRYEVPGVMKPDAAR